MLFRLGNDPLLFPDPALAEPDGLLAIGGDLSVSRLTAAYASGIFPWYSEGEPLLWWSPDPRCVILPEHFRIPRSVRRALRLPFEHSFNRAFTQVMEACARMPRPDQDGTWILPEMISAYSRLHARGLACSSEVWENGELVAGTYGVLLGQAFFGESMFHTRPEASKIALTNLLQALFAQGIRIVDCQMQTPHIIRYGATMISRALFLEKIEEAISRKPVPGSPYSINQLGNQISSPTTPSRTI